LGAGSFLTLGLGSMAAARALPPRKVVVGCMVAAWALRLGGFLVYRVHRVGHDSRFDEAKKQPLKYWVFWTMQAAWVFVTLSPVLLLNTASLGGPARLVWSDFVGVGMWALGLGIEAVADAQKFAFKMDPANKGKFIDTGLWSYAR
jgi:steroid 5-alpha reductase family enzyme